MSTAVWLINSYDAKRNVLACLSYYGSPELCLPPLIEHFLGLRLVPPDTPWAHDFKSLFSWCWQREFLIMIVIKGNCVLAGKHCQLAKFGYGVSLSLSLSLARERARLRGVSRRELEARFSLSRGRRAEEREREREMRAREGARRERRERGEVKE